LKNLGSIKSSASEANLPALNLAWVDRSGTAPKSRRPKCPAPSDGLLPGNPDGGPIVGGVVPVGGSVTVPEPD
jgi:hypothetical protein